MLTSASLWLALVSLAQAERITAFDVDIEVQNNSDLLVTERITYDFESADRRGIFRTIPGTHPQAATAWHKKRYIDIEPISATRNGQPEQFVDEDTGPGVFVRVGQADQFITGVHKYEITYRVRGAVSEYAATGVTELNWNVTGDEWSVPMDTVSVTLTAADQVELLPPAACYTGVTGSTDSCRSIATQATSTVFSEADILPGAQLTIAQAVRVPGPITVLEKSNWLLLVLASLGAFLLGLGYRVYRWMTRFKTGAPIIAQYEPYEDFKPMFTGVLFDGRLDARDITASIVYLAQRGFLKITHTKETVLGLFDASDYEVTLLRPHAEADARFEQDVLSLLFAGQRSVSAVQAGSFMSRWFSADTADAESLVVGKTIRLSDIQKNTSKKQENYTLLQAMKRAVKQELQDRGFTQTVVFTRRTRKGYEALDYLAGFKEFLSVTEKERYQFHNAPQKSPEQFMEYLPYAIAFGVEKQWAKVFEDISIASPGWYDGGAAGAAFNVNSFASDMSAFSSSLSSAGSSASSGGGSAGGGGGGGGGGSW